jgi:hypothetical protein
MSERTDKVKRRRRRTLLVPLVGVGIAAWAVRRGLGDRPDLGEGWQTLPPAPRPEPVSAQPAPTATRTAVSTPAASAAPATTDEPVSAVAPPVEEPVVEEALVEPPVVEPPVVEPPVVEEAADQPAAEELAAARARAVPTAAAVASVTAPALPDTPYGPGSRRALADGSSPDPDYTIKGKTATKVFHAPGGAYYTRTRADVWFRTVRDARGAGFTERTRRHS